MNKRGSKSGRNSKDSGSSQNSDNIAMENLDTDTQQTLLRTFENFYEQESEIMIAALEESREELKNSMLDLCLEQDKYKEELSRVSEGKYESKRKKGEILLIFQFSNKNFKIIKFLKFYRKFYTVV